MKYFSLVLLILFAGIALITFSRCSTSKNLAEFKKYKFDLDTITKNIVSHQHPHIMYFDEGNEIVAAQVGYYMNLFFYNENGLDSINTFGYHYYRPLNRCYFQSTDGIGYIDGNHNITILDSNKQKRLHQFVDLSSSSDIFYLNLAPKSLYENKLLDEEYKVSKFSTGKIYYHISNVGKVKRIFSYKDGLTSMFSPDGKLITNFEGKVGWIYCDEYYNLTSNEMHRVVDSKGEVTISNFTDFSKRQTFVKQIGLKHGFFMLRNDTLDLGYIVDFSNGNIIDTVAGVGAINENWYVKEGIDGKYIYNARLDEAIKVDDYLFYHDDSDHKSFQYTIGDTTFVQSLDGPIVDKYYSQSSFDRTYYSNGWYSLGDSLLKNYITHKEIKLTLEYYPPITDIAFVGGTPAYLTAQCIDFESNKTDCLHQVGRENTDQLEDKDYINFCGNRLILAKAHGDKWSLYFVNKVKY